MLGFDEYIESHGDGLQILRYNQTTAYSTLHFWNVTDVSAVHVCMIAQRMIVFDHCLVSFFSVTNTVPHMDYLDIDKRLEHDYDSSQKGGNRFATILLYMTDLAEKDGGETVFIDAWPTGQQKEDHVPIETVRHTL